MDKDSKLTKTNIIDLFSALNSHLLAIDRVEEIYLCGGIFSVMADIRNATKDIDSFRQFDPSLQYLIRSALTQYNTDNITDQIQDDWLNDSASKVVPEDLEYERAIEFAHFNNLIVYKLTDLSMLIAKVKAARMRDDKSDLPDAKYYQARTKTTKEELVSLLGSHGIPVNEGDVEAEWLKREEEIGDISMYQEGDKAAFIQGRRKEITNRQIFINKLYEQDDEFGASNLF